MSENPEEAIASPKTEAISSNTSDQKANELSKLLAEYKTQIEENGKKINNLEEKVKVITAERDSFKNQVNKLEKELENAIKLPENQEILNLKNNSEDMLTRAKGLIFEKTKVCKNQELQIEALNQQVSSLKDVVSITKDLLNIRNMETKHLQDKLDGMESKINCEKERQELMHTKLARMIEMNGDLKREYEAQLCLFNALREKYNERELAKNVLDELRRPAPVNAIGEGSANRPAEAEVANGAAPNQNGPESDSHPAN